MSGTRLGKEDHKINSHFTFSYIPQFTCIVISCIIQCQLKTFGPVFLIRATEAFNEFRYPSCLASVFTDLHTPQTETAVGSEQSNPLLCAEWVNLLCLMFS